MVGRCVEVSCARVVLPLLLTAEVSLRGNARTPAVKRMSTDSRNPIAAKTGRSHRTSLAFCALCIALTAACLPTAEPATVQNESLLAARNIDLPFGSRPSYVVVNPITHIAYISYVQKSGSEQLVGALIGGALGPILPLPAPQSPDVFTRTGSMAVDLTRNLLHTWAFTTGDGTSTTTIATYDTLTNAVRSHLRIDGSIFRLTVDPTSGKLYASAREDGTHVLENGLLQKTLSVGGYDVAINPRVHKAYVSSIRELSIAIVDTETDTVSTVIPLRFAPWHAVVDCAINKTIVADRSGHFAIIDGNSDVVSAVGSARGGDSGGGEVITLAVDDKRHLAYLGGNAVDMLTGSIKSTIPLGEALAVNAATDHVYVVDRFASSVLVAEGSTGNFLGSFPAALDESEGSNNIAMDPQTGLVYVVGVSAAMTILQDQPVPNAPVSENCPRCSTEVTRFKQSGATAPWSTDNYDDRNVNNKDDLGRYRVGELGCNLTVLAMQLSAIQQKLPDGRDLNPGTLNEWAQSHHGYDHLNHDVVQSTLTTQVLGPPWTFSVSQGGSSDANVLQQLLCEGNKGQPTPVMVGVRTTSAACGATPATVPCHFVLATGIENGQVLVADPAGSSSRTSLDQYPAFADGSRFRIHGFLRDPEDLSFLSVRFEELVDLQVQDMLGRVTSLTQREIPSSGYLSWTIASGGADDPASEHTSSSPRIRQAVEVNAPASGTYRVTVIGRVAGIYNIHIIALSQLGTPQDERVVSGVTAPGSIAEIILQLDTTTESPATLQRIISYATTSSDLRSAIDLGLIDSRQLGRTMQVLLQLAERAKQGCRVTAERALLSVLLVLVSGPSSHTHIAPPMAAILIEDFNRLRDEAHSHCH